MRDVISLKEQFSRKDILSLCSRLETSSEHHIARAIVNAATQRHPRSHETTEIKVLPGRGVQGTINGKTYLAGNIRMFPESAQTSTALAEHKYSGMTKVFFGTEKEIIGVITLEDQLRDEAIKIISDLKQKGILTSVLSGDSAEAVESAVEQAGIDDSYSQLLPEEKLGKIEEMSRQTKCLVMVGDGINDAPSLTAADIGIAMGKGGTDVALETADMALMSDNLELIPYLVHHSKRTMKIIRQNIFFSLATKLLFIILSVSGISSLWMAVLADTGLSLLVTSNSLRLLKTKKLRLPRA